MYQTPRDLIDALGGYQAVSDATGISPKTLSSHIVAGALPAKRFFQFLEIAKRLGKAEPQRELFSFHPKSPSGAPSGVEAAE